MSANYDEALTPVSPNNRYSLRGRETEQMTMRLPRQMMIRRWQGKEPQRRPIRHDQRKGQAQVGLTRSVM